MVYYVVSVLFLRFSGVPAWRFNVSVQYKGGLLPDIIILFDPMLFPSGNPFKRSRGFVFAAFDPTYYGSSSKRFDIFPPLTGGCSEGLIGAF